MFLAIYSPLVHVDMQVDILKLNVNYEVSKAEHNDLWPDGDLQDWNEQL